MWRLQKSIEIFVAGIVQRSKDIQTLIAALPKKDDSSARAERLQELQAEMVVADREYKEALEEAELLLAKVQAKLATALETPLSQDPSLAPLAKQISQATRSGASEGGLPPDPAQAPSRSSSVDTEL